MPDYTHKELVDRASYWLRRRCAVVATDVIHGKSETPDAIGFTGYGATIMCEAKASRSDFQADSKKPFRRIPGMGMGEFRYYVAPAGMLTADDLPDGWGLLETYGSGLIKRVESKSFIERNTRSEQSVLVSLLRRIGRICPKGVAIKAYTYDTPSPKATLGIKLDRMGVEDNA